MGLRGWQGRNHLEGARAVVLGVGHDEVLLLGLVELVVATA